MFRIISMPSSRGSLPSLLTGRGIGRNPTSGKSCSERSVASVAASATEGNNGPASSVKAATTASVSSFVPIQHFDQGYAHQSCRLFDSVANQRAFEEYRANLGPARRKFFDILNKYRSENYAQSLPSRFLKDIIHAADANNDGVITMEEYQNLLKNIGAEDNMTTEELDDMLDEVGVAEDVTAGRTSCNKVVPVSTLMEKWKPFLKTVPPSSS